MVNLKRSNGITLMVLIITIIIISIIAGISIVLSIDTVDQTIETQDRSEMLIIQHAIQEKYIEYLETKNETLFKGVKDPENNNYTIGPDHFDDLGLAGRGIQGSTFIVNYETGYVKKVGSSASELKGYNKDTDGNTTSFVINITN